MISCVRIRKLERAASPFYGAVFLCGGDLQLNGAKRRLAGDGLLRAYRRILCVSIRSQEKQREKSADNN